MKYSYKCPSCGANITVDTENMQLFCQFCGSSLPDAQEIVKQSMELSDKESERQHQQKLQEIREKSGRSAIISIIVIASLGFLAIIALVVMVLKA